MKKYTKAEILKLAKENNVSYVRLQFSDILGSDFLGGTLQ